jgi:hypothetical protein
MYNDLINNFVNEGNLGERFVTDRNRLVSESELWPSVKKNIEDAKSEDDMYKIFDNGFFFIVPSFFETIIKLTEQNRDF